MVLTVVVFTTLTPGSRTSAQAAAIGSIEGVVTVPWVRDASIVVAAIPAGGPVGPIVPAPILDQHDLTFLPRVLPVTLGTTVRFRNSDPFLHNVFSPSRRVAEFDLGTYPQGEDRSVLFSRVGVSVVLCNVHPQMAAFVLVLETPYWVVADAEGRYALNGLPAGSYTLRFWSESAEVVERSVEVRAAETETVDMTFETRRRGGWIKRDW